MNTLFGMIEPLSTTEMLANYWHFLKSIDAEERDSLGPIEVVLKSRTVARGWPVGLKNQTLALLTDPEITAKSALVFVDIAEVSAVTFSAAHMILPFVSAGAISRSPLEQRMTHEAAKKELLYVLEQLKQVWPARVYFDADPMGHGVDELMNLADVLRALLGAVQKHGENPVVFEELQTMKAFHIANSPDMKDVALSRRESGEIELAFHFSRALPKNLDETIATLFVSMF